MFLQERKFKSIVTEKKREYTIEYLFYSGNKFPYKELKLFEIRNPIGIGIKCTERGKSSFGLFSVDVSKKDQGA